MISFSAFSAFCDELCKIAGLPPLLPAAAKALKAPAAAALAVKPKMYGQEGFHALMHGAQSSKTNPFQNIVPH